MGNSNEIKMIKEIKVVKVDDLRPYENNPRFNDDAVQNVTNSIKEFGFKVPIVIDKNNTIVCGHTRYKASLELGLKEVPCVLADDLSPKQIKAYRLADNKVGEKSEWNTELLNEELEELFKDFNMNDFGFPIQIENIEIDELEDVEEEKICKELDEANNYVVLQFYTNTEWEEAMEVLGIERVRTNEENEKIRRHGIGRVIDGAPIVNKLKGE